MGSYESYNRNKRCDYLLVTSIANFGIFRSNFLFFPWHLSRLIINNDRFVVPCIFCGAYTMLVYIYILIKMVGNKYILVCISSNLLLIFGALLIYV
jgi:hypothetical protein